MYQSNAGVQLLFSCFISSICERSAVHRHFDCEDSECAAYLALVVKSAKMEMTSHFPQCRAKPHTAVNSERETPVSYSRRLHAQILMVIGNTPCDVHPRSISVMT